MFQRRTFVRFFLVGVMNTGFSYALYAAFLYSGLGYVVASFLTILISIGFGFATQGGLVFGGLSRDAFVRFVAVWVLIYLAYLAVVATAEYIGINSYLGGLVATPMVAVLSYLLQRHLVFRPDHPVTRTS